MSGQLDPRLTALERRLERALPSEPATALRHRVLTAVDDVLANRRPKADGSGDVPVPGWAWAAAAAVGVAITLPVVSSAAALTRVEPPALVARLRAAGLADDVLPLSVAARAGQPTVAAAAAPGEPLPRGMSTRTPVHLIDVRKLLEENL